MNESVSGKWVTGRFAAAAAEGAATGAGSAAADVADSCFWQDAARRQAERPVAMRKSDVKEGCIIKRVSIEERWSLMTRV